MRRERVTSKKCFGLPRARQLKSRTAVTVDGHHNSPAFIEILQHLHREQYRP